MSEVTVLTSPLDGIASAVGEHAAIMVFNKIYDYNADGLQVNENVKDGLEGYNGKSKVGKTKKSKSEFENWISKNYKWGEDDYDVPTNNCIHFVKECCEFLGVSLPGRLNQILFACRDPVIRVAASLGQSSNRSRSSR